MNKLILLAIVLGLLIVGLRKAKICVLYGDGDDATDDDTYGS